MDPIRDPVPPLLELLPRLRSLARALACNVEGGDALVYKAVGDALAADDDTSRSKVTGLLLDGWRNGSDQSGAEANDVDAALASLAPEEREAVALVLIDGLGYCEAAELLGIDVAALIERLARGRGALAARLAP